ncbi:AP-4 complex subunit epsilon-1 [Apophysomyces sp. BC1021]|nr:AP-4 complex subunit epsilon-1 [Apophysomyces sp. BC1021]
MMTQSGEMPVQRRVGYLVCSLFLESNHELGIMLINTLQRDLKSENYLDKCAALNAICYLDHPETEANVLDATINAMGYPKQVMDHASRRLCSHIRVESHPYGKVYPHLNYVTRGLIGSMQEHAEQYKDMLPLFIQVHKMIMNSHIHRSFMYHGVMAPWAQIACLQIFEIYQDIGVGSQEELYQLLVDCLAAVERKVDAAYAIVLQCVQLLGSMDIQIPTDDNPFRVLDKFLASPNHNMKYLGLLGIGYVDRHMWTDEWPDRSTITDAVVAAGDDDVLVTKVKQPVFEALEVLDITMDETLLRTDCKVDAWSVETTIRALAESRKNLNDDYVEIQCQRLKEFLLDEINDTELRERAVNVLYELLKKYHSDQYHPQLVQFAFWVLGEHTYLSSSVSEMEVMRQMQKWIVIVEDNYIQVCGLHAIRQCVLRSKTWLPGLKKILLNYKLSPVPEKQEISREILDLIEDTEFEQKIESTDISPLSAPLSLSANPNRPLTSRYADDDDITHVYPRGTLGSITDVQTYPARSPSERHRESPSTARKKADVSWRQDHTTRHSWSSPKPSTSQMEGRMKREEESMLSSLIALELDETIDNERYKRSSTALRMDTESFGALWLKYKYEQKLSLEWTSKDTTPESLASYMSKSWGIRVVEMIGDEFLAVDLSGQLKEPLLLYASFQGHTPEITIRASAESKLRDFTHLLNLG